MEPWQSWALVGVIGAGAYYYYSTHTKAGARRARQKPFNGKLGQRTEVAVERSSSDGAEKQRKQKKKTAARVPSQAVAANDLEVDPTTQEQEPRSHSESTGRKGRGQAGSTTARKAAHKSRLARGTSVNPSTAAKDDGHEEQEDNREFARQLSSLATGSSLQSMRSSTMPPEKRSGKTNGSTTNPTGSKDDQSESTKKSGSNQSSKKNTRKAEDHEASHEASEKPPIASSRDVLAPIISSTASTASFDADDDSSAVTSPGFPPLTSTFDAAGVSDMLETSGSGPSILRITQPDEWQTARPKNARKQHTPAELETKRQRQNRARADARKLEIQEAESQRRALMERQMRTARELERKEAERQASRQAARNQQQQAGLVASLPLANAWNDRRSGGTAALVEAETEKSSMLDTFEKKTVEDPWADWDDRNRATASQADFGAQKPTPGETNGLTSQSAETYARSDGSLVDASGKYDGSPAGPNGTQ